MSTIDKTDLPDANKGFEFFGKAVRWMDQDLNKKLPTGYQFADNNYRWRVDIQAQDNNTTWLSIEVVTSANKRELTHSLLFALKPVVCKQCNTRFADNVLLSSHLKFCNVTGLTSSKIKPGTMTVPT